MRKLTTKLWAPMLLAILWLPVAQAQQQQQQTPPPTTPPTTPPVTPPTTTTPPVSPTQPVAPLQPAGSQDSGNPSSAGQQQEPVSPIATPTPPVTGGFSPAMTVSGSDETVSRLLIGLNVGEFYDSNVTESTIAPGPDEITNFSGNFDLHRFRQNSDLSLRYIGGGYIDAQHSTNDTTYHQFEATETIQFRRWTLRLDDLFSYLPSSPFGFIGGGPQGSTLLGVIYQNPALAPDQSILTVAGQRISNEGIGEVDIALSPRSTMTFTGGFGYLHFFTPGFLDAIEGSFEAGYNYNLTGKNTVGFQYVFNDIEFNPVRGSIKNSTLLGSYGRHLGRQFVLQVGVGPQFNSFTPPGSSTASNILGISANASVAYSYKRTTLTASYYRGVGGGSGVVIGDSSNDVQVSASQGLGRFWTIRGSGGASFTQSLIVANPIPTTFIGVFAGAGFTRQLGPQMSLYANYTLLHQNTGPNPVCATAICGVTFTTNQVWVGFSWTMRPIGLN